MPINERPTFLGKLESHHFGTARPYDPVMLRRVGQLRDPIAKCGLKSLVSIEMVKCDRAAMSARVGSCQNKPD